MKINDFKKGRKWAKKKKMGILYVLYANKMFYHPKMGAIEITVPSVWDPFTWMSFLEIERALAKA